MFSGPVAVAREGAVYETSGVVVPRPAPEPAPETRSAAVTTDVNLRAEPDNGAAVILVVSASNIAYTFRGLVMANPLWYPALKAEIRNKMLVVGQKN